MKVVTRPFDAANYIDSPEMAAAYLSEALREDDDPTFFFDAVGAVARAAGMGKIAGASGLGRESLYKALSKSGNPSFRNIFKLLRALGLEIAVSVPTRRRKATGGGRQRLTVDTRRRFNSRPSQRRPGSSVGRAAD